MEWGDEGRGRQARREENEPDLVGESEAQTDGDQWNGLRSVEPSDVWTTAVPGGSQGSGQEGSAEVREQRREGRRPTSPASQGEWAQVRGFIRNQQGCPCFSAVKPRPVLMARRKPHPLAAPPWGLLPACCSSAGALPRLLPRHCADSGHSGGAPV